VSAYRRIGVSAFLRAERQAIHVGLGSQPGREEGRNVSAYGRIRAVGGRLLMGDRRVSRDARKKRVGDRAVIYGPIETLALRTNN
jgi:hypothetical protein